MVAFTLQSSILFFEEIHVDMTIGAFVQETFQKQPVLVSIAISSPAFEQNVRVDSITSTYDYGQLIAIVRKLAKKQYVLVEAFAQEIANNVLENTSIDAVEVIVEKKGAFVDARSCGCRIKRTQRVG